MKIYRMHGASYPVFDTGGAMFREGRWHLRGTRVVYAAQHVSLAVLETLVHANSQVLPPKLLTEIEVPEGVGIEYAGWMELPESRRFGSRWVLEGRTAVLGVPSIMTQLMELNFVLNPAHPEFARITHGAAVPFALDGGLFAAASRSR